MHEVTWSMYDIDIPVLDDPPEYPPDMAVYAVIEFPATYRGLVPRLR